MTTIPEPARDTPVVVDCDLCVVGGSSTGVYAAVAAARQGLNVALIEAMGGFGGTATASLVCLWHSALDTVGGTPIFAGLVGETLDALRARGVAADHGSPQRPYTVFLPAELMLELDRLITDAGVRPFLHARFVTPLLDGRRITAVVIEDKSGRRAIRAKQFIDATGDGDLLHRAGFETWRVDGLQPPTACAIVQGLGELAKQNPGFHLGATVFDPKYPEALPPGFLWTAALPGHDLTMVAGTRVHGIDASDADQLTAAELAGRAQVAQMMAVLRKHVPGGDQVTLQGLPWRIGIRQTRQAVCQHRLTEQEVLHGVRFPDAIANGSYPVDIHYPDRGGIIFRHLDGREIEVSTDGRHDERRWRPEQDVDPTFYQIPYRSLVPVESENLLVAGRCIDADRGAFGAIRVMVNASQTGEAAGVAAAMAIREGGRPADVDPERLRTALREQGALII